MWWMTLGIRLGRDDPGHLEQNGGYKSMHRDMKRELQGQRDGSLNEHQKVCEWRKDFNEVRPYEGLEMKTRTDRTSSSSALSKVLLCCAPFLHHIC